MSKQPKHESLERPFVGKILDGHRMLGVDIGAAYGLPPHWRTFHGSVKFYAFEPHPETQKQLQELYAQSGHPEMYVVVPVALSGTGGTRTLYLTNDPANSSLLPVDVERFSDYFTTESKHFFPCRETKIDTRTLTDVFDELEEPAIDLMKLDIQGAELEVLQGLDSRRLDRHSGGYKGLHHV